MMLAGASLAWADDLPPIPKTIPVTVSAVIKEKPASAADAPLPPVSGKVRTTCECNTCCRPIERTVAFLANELVRKPLYQVQKTINELECRRLCREAENLAAGLAALECKKAHHQQQTAKIKAKHAELYGE
jgi:hypothetical protein